MASFENVYLENKEQVEFFKEVSTLIDSQQLRVGQKYSWPEYYIKIFNSGDLIGILNELLSGTGFNFQITGNTVEITL